MINKLNRFILLLAGCSFIASPNYALADVGEKVRQTHIKNIDMYG